MNNIKSNENGKRGEDFAAVMLEKQGFRIIARNFRKKCGEIDLIAANRKYLVFIEVKTRTVGSLISPAEAVNLLKQRKIIKTAMLYLAQNSTELQPRFDVFVVRSTPEGLKGIHIPGAFEITDQNSPRV